jgi:hypothetical protein
MLNKVQRGVPRGTAESSVNRGFRFPRVERVVRKMPKLKNTHSFREVQAARA